MTDGPVPVCAVVLASRGGRHVRAALDELAWAAERVVLDPAGAIAARDLPPAVGVGRDAAAITALGGAPWVLLLAEHESWTPGLAEAVARATAAEASAYRPTLELETLGVRLRVPQAAPRLAPRRGCRMALDRGLEIGLASPLAVRALGAPVRVRRGDSVAEAFAELEADGQVLSILLAQLGGAPGGLVTAPLATLLRVLGSRADRRAGMARWVAAVFAAYRVVVAQARWWEWRHARPAPVREVG